MLEVWVSWWVVDDDATDLDVVIDSVLRILHQVDKVLNVANTKEKIIALTSKIVWGLRKLGTVFDQISCLALVLVKDCNIITSPDQECSKLMSCFTKTDPSYLSLLIVLNDLSTVLFDPIRELEWLSILHKVIPVVLSIFVLDFPLDKWDVVFPVTIPIILHLSLLHSWSFGGHHLHSRSWGLFEPLVGYSEWGWRLGQRHAHWSSSSSERSSWSLEFHNIGIFVLVWAEIHVWIQESSRRLQAHLRHVSGSWLEVHLNSHFLFVSSNGSWRLHLLILLHASHLRTNSHTSSNEERGLRVIDWLRLNFIH